MDKQKLIPHTSSLNTNLQYYLGRFDKNQQWADVAPLLLKIDGLLQTHPSPYIMEKIQLAKRLSQCLNPQLSAPIHSSVLKIYDQLFKNMQNYKQDENVAFVKLIMDDLALFSIGLFPFFQLSSSKIRPQFLQLISEHYVPLKRELIPMIPGLLSSILPGLDDQSERIQKQCLAVLDQLSQSVGRRYLFGAVWLALLRSKKCRSAGIKFLQQRIPKMPVNEDEKEDDYLSDVYSDDEEGKEVEEVIQTQVEQQTLIDEPKVVEDPQSEAAQKEIQSQTIMIEQGIEVKRKQSLLQIEDGIDDESAENNYPSIYINSIIACLEDENQLIKRSMLDFLFTHLKCQQLGERGLLISAVLKLLIRKDLSVTRRVNQWLFGKPDLDNKYCASNPEILADIIKAFNGYYSEESDNPTFPIKLLQNFYMEHDHMVVLLINDISLSFIGYAKAYQSPDVIKACKRVLESITSYLLYLVDRITEKFNPLVAFLFDVLITSEDNYEPNTEYRILHLAANNLLNCISNMSVNQLQNEQPGRVLNSILIRMEQLKIGGQQDELQLPRQYDYDSSLEQFGILYEGLSQQLDNEDLIPEFQQLSQCLVRAQRFRQMKQFQQLPKWFDSITRTIKEENPSVSLLAIESMIEILVSSQVDPVYESLKRLIIEQSRSKLSKDQLIEGQDYTKLTLEKLWNLLDYPFFHDRIIQMIVNLSKVFPLFFTEVVINQFQQNQEPAIRRFAVFWKLSASHYKDLQELNKVGLFLMLDFLDHENPIIRHNAKNWLLESTGMLERILDPLFEVLIQSSSSWYVTERQQIFFAKIYDTRRINETIKKLKSILVSFSSQFMDYVQHNEISLYIKDIRMHFTSEVSVVMQQGQMQYLDLLTIITLKYVQGQAIESMSSRFYKENQAVNASACEYIELLISNVEDPLVSLHLAEYIMQPLQVVLYHSIENEDLVMQVQLLNLFKVLFFNSAFRTKYLPSQKELIEDTMSRTISNEIFIPTLIRGMNTTVLYVRAQYIQFISTCIPLLAEHLFPQTLTDCVQKVLSAYFRMIQEIANRKYNQEAKSTQKMNQFDYLQGSSQHEIQTILVGVKTILKHILGIQERDDIVMNKVEVKQNMFDVVSSMFTFGLLNVQEPQRKIQKITFQKFQHTCEAIIGTLPQILELYINCWECSPSFLQYAEELTLLGMGTYSFEKLNGYNKNLESKTKDTNIVKPQILNMLKPLFTFYNREFMTSLLQVWHNQLQSISKVLQQEQSVMIDPLSLQQNSFLQRAIELLVMIECPVELLLDSIMQSQQMLDMQRFYDVQRRKKLTTVVLNYGIAQQETSILYFMYAYFSYVYIDSSQLKRELLLQFWTQTMKLLQLFGQSRCPSTSLWLLEIQLLLTRKYSPKEIVSDQRFRNCHHEFINEKLQLVAQFAAKGFPVFWNDPTQKVEPEDALLFYNSRFKVILPLTPSLYDIYQNVIKQLSDEVKFEITDIEKIIFCQMGNIIEDDLYAKYRLMSLKTLKSVSLEILQNSYAVEKTDRVVLRCKEFMEFLFPLMENRAQHNQIFVQCVSEVLFTLLDKARQMLIKVFRQPILDIFNREDFFQQSQITLRYWAKIMNWVVQCDKNDLFVEYLEMVSLQSSIFTSENEENKRRIKSFERICFVIFAGERDRYTLKLSQLIDKISLVIKTENAHPGLVILILFCVRILILRLSAQQLNELFRSMWPTLLTLLITIYKNPKSPINLVLAALKLIEMISLTQQDEFYFHQWVFIYDYFGLEISENADPGPISPFLYQPLFSNYFQKHYSIDYNGKSLQNSQKREIIIKLIKVDNKEQLEDIAIKLLTYLIKLNSTRTQINPDEIEKLIENDFIQLDEFLYEK